MAGDIDPNSVGPQTLAVIAGRDTQRQFGFVNPPVCHGSTIIYPSVERLRDRKVPYTYGSIGGPAHETLETAIAQMEGGYRTRLTSSGKSATTLALLSLARAGDHILVVDNVYRPTRNFTTSVMGRLGVETEFFDPALGGGVSALMRPNTRLVIVEAPGSQTFEMLDVPAVAEAAHAAGAFVLMDNTWASPAYFKPFAHGVDVSVQAATKYIVGHSDAMLGSVTTTRELWDDLDATYKVSGICVGPDDVYLGQRGLRTIHVRLARHMSSGIELAEWLQQRPEVAEVRHPALPSHPGHALWKRDFLGASGLFGIVLKPCSQDAADAFLNALRLFGMGYSWGGYESLIIPVDPRSYRTATTWNANGPALRLHVGLEDVADLKSDLEAGFAALAAAG